MTQLGAVLAHDGHAVAFLDAARGQRAGGLLDLLLQLQVDDGLLPDRGDRRQAAVLVEGPFQQALDGQLFEFDDHGRLLDRQIVRNGGKNVKSRQGSMFDVRGSKLKKKGHWGQVKIVNLSSIGAKGISARSYISLRAGM